MPRRGASETMSRVQARQETRALFIRQMLFRTHAQNERQSWGVWNNQTMQQSRTHTHQHTHTHTRTL